MAYINQSASEIGTVEFENGNRTTFWIDRNRNTGAPIVWQRCNDRKARRMTGRNMRTLLDELEFALNEGEARWLKRADAALDGWIAAARGPATVG